MMPIERVGDQASPNNVLDIAFCPGQSGQSWTKLDKAGQSWTKGTFWTKRDILDKAGQNLSRTKFVPTEFAGPPWPMVQSSMVNK
jgi:hypothetical protein